jgi:RNA polymerase sigma-70 factor (ECF subfamily)
MSFEKSDEDIIELYKNGDEQIFKSLVDKYTPPLYNFVVHLADKNNAADIVQETFIKVWKNMRKFDAEKASFKTWIFTIAKNTATDFLRKKKSIVFSDIYSKENYGEKEADNSFEESVLDEKILPDEALQKIQDSEMLNQLLTKIPLDYKTILILHYQEDMTFDQIGQLLDKPLNTVKSQHRRVLIMLRKLIDET